MSFYMRPRWRAGSAWNARREPPPGMTTYGNGSWVGGEFRYITSAPLVAHDDCAHEAGTSGHPWDKGRDKFGELAGCDWCWSPGSYSDNPDTAPDCFYCGEPCLTANRPSVR